jgi:tRNA G18 (ribose-2'-O)-methylase SpoU
MNIYRNQLPLTIVLDRIRSAYNVGSVLRTAACAYAEEVMTCGYAPKANHPKVQKTSLGSEEMIASRHYETVENAINDLKAQNYNIFAFETSKSATNLWEKEFEFSHDQKSAMIFGHEVEGLDLDQLSNYEIEVIEIPMPGPKKSLNIANASSIAIYEFSRQYNQWTI